MALHTLPELRLWSHNVNSITAYLLTSRDRLPCRQGQFLSTNTTAMAPPKHVHASLPGQAFSVTWKEAKLWQWSRPDCAAYTATAQHHQIIKCSTSQVYLPQVWPTCTHLAPKQKCTTRSVQQHPSQLNCNNKALALPPTAGRHMSNSPKLHMLCTYVNLHSHAVHTTSVHSMQCTRPQLGPCVAVDSPLHKCYVHPV
jgi:hypothetical protein